jgi:hypothetical protein
MALTCSFCDAPVSGVAPAGSPVSCCRFCALEYLPAVLAEALLTGGDEPGTPAGVLEDFGRFLGAFHDAVAQAPDRLLPVERN